MLRSAEDVGGNQGDRGRTTVADDGDQAEEVLELQAVVERESEAKTLGTCWWMN